MLRLIKLAIPIHLLAQAQWRAPLAPHAMAWLEEVYPHMQSHQRRRRARSGGLKYAALIERPRKAIHVIHVKGGPHRAWNVDEILERARQHMLSRYGEQDADVVLVQESAKVGTRLFGLPASTSRVRAALSAVPLSWEPIDLD